MSMITSRIAALLLVAALFAGGAVMSGCGGSDSNDLSNAIDTAVEQGNKALNQAQKQLNENVPQAQKKLEQAQKKANNAISEAQKQAEKAAKDAQKAINNSGY